MLDTHLKHTVITNPISKTAYYTLGVRAWDASLPNPACGDTLAKLFMNEDAQMIWQEFKDDLKPNASNASRHAIIDRQLAEALSDHADAQVVIIGVGFDTRAFRIKGGRWIEVDEPAIIGYKETKLPASKAPNPLTRIPIEFARDSLSDSLSSFSTKTTTHIILEGVLMYLNQADRLRLIAALQEIFPHHIVYCDLMRRSFFERYSKKIHGKILSLGATFADISEHPENLFLGNQYKPLSCVSIPLSAAEHGNLGIPIFVVRYFFKTLRDGYSNWRFEFRR
ncbi:class I SAM-dependent methyltransferase [Chryseolinea sp. H1M3-3]|uniref:class I SAM-dependent methyltransferase n=1 Tax=Chryseolinea sp. H1M3-3 TaxID=3034144 RepID=UPI0023EC1C4A|nr:class I SAM-dependent methyltransferase [Chryseolinea sp. H1M3-3]